MHKDIKHALKLAILRNKWRKANQHNRTIPENLFDISKVTVGKCTYGDLNVHCFGNTQEGLSIGNFVSIADGVKFILGGNHRHDCLSTYPFNTHVFNEPKVEAVTRGKIIVEDDVWIGSNCIILSGVTVKQGAVLGAGSIVTRDIPAYAIAVGCPARAIKYRFDMYIIEKLLQIDFAKIDIALFFKYKQLLQMKIDQSNIDEIVSSFCSQ